MHTTDQLTDRILALAQRVPGLQAATLADAWAEASAMERVLLEGAAHWLGRAPVPEETDLGVQLAQAAIDIGPAVKALATARQWYSRTPAPQVLEQVVAINLRLARGSLLRALRPLAKGSPHGCWPDVPDVPSVEEADGGQAAMPGEALSVGGGGDTDLGLGLLRNIATHHREHERFHTVDLTESAVELYREANKLRIVAGVWLSGEGRASRTDVDFTRPQFQAAGCEDLNALQAIAAIGVLFMEGGSEPAEIRVMKARLQAMAGSWTQVGQWLADKIDAAWEREQATCTPALIALVQPRFNTIATNWRGAREMSLAGRLLTLAVASLRAIDFSPGALRADRAGAGRRLLATSWMVSLAAQVCARSAAELAENDRNWTVYLDSLSSPGMNG